MPVALVTMLLAGWTITFDEMAMSAIAAERCVASVYWEGFGRPLADGRRHRAGDVLAAHRTLPFGTLVRVTVAASDKSLVLPIADRGPYVAGRCLDLSRGAARLLGIDGLARVRVEPIPSSPPAEWPGGSSFQPQRNR